MREPGLRDDVLAVVRLHVLDGGFRARGRAERLPPLADLHVLADQPLGVVFLLGIDAPDLAVRLEVDPGIELDGGLVAGPLAVRALEQAREIARLDAFVVALGVRPICLRVEVGPILGGGKLPQSGVQEVQESDTRAVSPSFLVA
jgi:hypothetical protein